MDTRDEVNTRVTLSRSKPITTRGLIGLFGVFAGLCAVFVLIATACDAWREHAQESWPKATATIEQGSVDSYRAFKSAGGGTMWFIRCRIRYLAGAEEVRGSIRSRSTASASDTELMRQWVARHEPGTQLMIHYNPDEHKTAVLTATDMPYAGPRTPDNLILLLIASSACVVLLTTAKLLRRDPLKQTV
jgi:hypothetical protein